MKKTLYSKLVFELVFASSLIAIFVLPAVVYGQTIQKRTEIIIQDGDTTVNGKKMKDMNAAERKDALGLFNNDAPPPPALKFRKGIPGVQLPVPPSPPKLSGRIQGFTLMPDGDSLKNYTYELRTDTAKDGSRRTYTYSYRGPQDRMPRMKPDMRNYRMPNMRDRDSSRPNFSYRLPDNGGLRNYRYTPHDEQNFNFNNVDKNGVATHIRFSITDASAFEAKNLGVSKTGLDLNDLAITPEFSTGKVWLMFNLDDKVPATVQFDTGNGKAVWVDKVSDGSFSKKFSLPANGVYLLKVQQGNKTAVKRIVKE